MKLETGDSQALSIRYFSRLALHFLQTSIRT